MGVIMYVGNSDVVNVTHQMQVFNFIGWDQGVRLEQEIDNDVYDYGVDWRQLMIEEEREQLRQIKNERRIENRRMNKHVRRFLHHYNMYGTFDINRTIDTDLILHLIEKCRRIYPSVLVDDIEKQIWQESML
jgi:hypothetical protein